MPIEKKIFDVCVWFVFLLTISCSPLSALPTSTATIPSAEAAPKSEVTTKTPILTCTVTTGYGNGLLNLRSGPGTRYAVLRLLEEGEVLTLTGVRAGSWIEVTAEHLTGWVNGRYCQEVRP